MIVAEQESRTTQKLQIDARENKPSGWFLLFLVTDLDSPTSSYSVDLFALSVFVFVCGKCLSTLYNLWPNLGVRVMSMLLFGLVWASEDFSGANRLGNAFVFLGALIGSVVPSSIIQELVSYMGFAITFRLAELRLLLADPAR